MSQCLYARVTGAGPQVHRVDEGSRTPKHHLLKPHVVHNTQRVTENHAGLEI